MSAQHRRDGFTLIELMIVVVIIGILALLAYPRFSGVTSEARQSEAGPILRQICQLAEADRERTGNWPAEMPSAWVEPNAQFFDFAYAENTARAEPKEGVDVILSTLNCETGDVSP